MRQPPPGPGQRNPSEGRRSLNASCLRFLTRTAIFCRISRGEGNAAWEQCVLLSQSEGQCPLEGQMVPGSHGDAAWQGLSDCPEGQHGHSGSDQSGEVSRRGVHLPGHQRGWEGELPSPALCQRFVCRCLLFIYFFIINLCAPHFALCATDHGLYLCQSRYTL